MDKNKLISEKLIFNIDSVKNKEELFANLADKYFELGIISDKEELISGLITREEQSSTGFEKGIAIPHTKVTTESPFISISRINDVNWPAMDMQMTNLVINIVVPKTKGEMHLKILAKLSAKLMDDDFINFLKTGSNQEIVKVINEIGNDETEVKAQVNESENTLSFVAVTGCPTGIAHTYMAAENIEKTAKKLGYKIKVETRGASGVENEITSADLTAIDGVIIAADVDVPMERFSRQKVVRVPVKRGLKDAESLFAEVQTKAVSDFGKETKTQSTSEFSAYKSLMNGVTHMLPFVIVGGILTAMRFIFGTEADIAAGVEPIINIPVLGTFLGNIGSILFGAMLPILGAYIAQSIGKRPGLMLGFLAGYMASVGGSGFLGAILGGFVAGFVALKLTKLSKKLPKSLIQSATILFVPLFGAIIVGLFMALFGIPIAMLNNGLMVGLEKLESFNPFLLGAIVGAMMAADMGGPINKAAYVTGTLLLAEGNQTFMAAVMAGGMVPPLAIAIATTINKSLYTSEEIDTGRTNYIMGLSFVTEGAIPFAAANPKKVIPALMFGSAIAGALTMAFKITLPAPHGGIFVFPLVNHPLLYLLAIFIGSICGALVLNKVKGEKK